MQVHGDSSDSATISNRVSQGFVLGPMLSIIYVNDLDCGVTSEISKFTDDTKPGLLTKPGNDAVILQNELTNLYE